MKRKSNLVAYLYLITSLIWVFMLGNYSRSYIGCSDTVEKHDIIIAIAFSLFFTINFLNAYKND